MIYRFSKYQGAGNDFILIDDRRLTFPLTASYISYLCHRKFGIGADGLILLQPSLCMRIFNADGHEVDMCGNGLRCLVRFLKEELHIVQEIYSIKTAHGVQTCWEKEGEICTALSHCRTLCEDLSLEMEREQVLLDWIHTGVPHVVLFCTKLKERDVAKQGKILRMHPYFGEAGTNVNFAEVQGNGTVAMRTFERGVEGETLACGTGAAAVAMAALRKYDLPSPLIIETASSEKLHVEVCEERVVVSGPARFVFRGFVG